MRSSFQTTPTPTPASTGIWRPSASGPRATQGAASKRWPRTASAPSCATGSLATRWPYDHTSPSGWIATSDRTEAPGGSSRCAPRARRSPQGPVPDQSPVRLGQGRLPGSWGGWERRYWRASGRARRAVDSGGLQTSSLPIARQRSDCCPVASDPVHLGRAGGRPTPAQGPRHHRNQPDQSRRERSGRTGGG